MDSADTDGMRPARTEDHPRLVAAIQQWWGDSRDPDQARELSLLLPKLFLQHFARTSLVVEHGDDLVAFLVGFHSPDRADEAYVHFVGVAPAHRRTGIAHALYTAFIDGARAAGRQRVRAITSPQNTGSIAFHQALGFRLEEADDGSTVFTDYDGPGHDRVSLVRDR